MTVIVNVRPAFADCESCQRPKASSGSADNREPPDFRESVPILVALSIGQDDVRELLHNGPRCSIHQAYGSSVMGPGKTVDLDKSG
jgi:hypothetical protein